MSDGRLWEALGRKGIVILVCVPVQFLLGLGLRCCSWMISRQEGGLFGLIMPMMVVPAVAGYMFYMLFQSGGPVNGILGALTGQNVAVAWLSNPTLALVAVMIADIWQWTPLMFLILLAGLVGVPSTRCGRLPSWRLALQRFVTIVLPRMKTIITIALAIRVIEILRSSTRSSSDRGRARTAPRRSASHLRGDDAGPDLGLCRGHRAGHLGRLSVLAAFAMRRWGGCRERDPPSGASSSSSGPSRRSRPWTSASRTGSSWRSWARRAAARVTTMNMIAGWRRPPRAHPVRRAGHGGRADGRRGVGFVFQNYAIFTHMTVRAEPELRPAHDQGGPRRGGAAHERMAEFLRLTPLLDRRADRLSVNILQRVAIGRSAVMEPAIFLLDEPLSNVDAAFRAVMRTELKSLQRQFRQTMIYVSHDPASRR
jgi:multiple sugar transport system permease protein